MSWVRVGEAERRREQGGGVVAGARDAADEGKVEEETYASLPLGRTKANVGEEQGHGRTSWGTDGASSLPVLFVLTWSPSLSRTRIASVR